jgi:hypothetical protein
MNTRKPDANPADMDTRNPAIETTLTREQAAFLAKIKAELDPVATEAELRDLLAQRDRGELISAAEFLAKLYGKDWEKEPT